MRGRLNEQSSNREPGQADADGLVWYVPHRKPFKLLGKDYHECAVDGVHPTDFGFFKMASGIKPTLEKLLFS